MRSEQYCHVIITEICDGDFRLPFPTNLILSPTVKRKQIKIKNPEENFVNFELSWFWVHFSKSHSRSSCGGVSSSSIISANHWLHFASFLIPRRKCQRNFQKESKLKNVAESSSGWPSFGGGMKKNRK
ncbi:unnamed protein product [Citrullus colocynthis]|uniref:Uncharacterized protein n=1 Tax=Citrullus colocynthis TaxID=252529 RepID=A0ABP0XT83_9ROSI